MEDKEALEVEIQFSLTSRELAAINKAIREGKVKSIHEFVTGALVTALRRDGCLP